MILFLGRLSVGMFWLLEIMVVGMLGWLLFGCVFCGVRCLCLCCLLSCLICIGWFLWWSGCGLEEWLSGFNLGVEFVVFYLG